MENLTKSASLVKLHEQAKNISFYHKDKIETIFRKIGSIAIDLHCFSLIIIDSQNILSYYSTMPTVEFNLFDKGLWIYDGIYDSANHHENSFLFWDDLYAQDLKNMLELEKERKFGFTYGFYVMKRVKDLFLIYSFATQTKKERVTFQKSSDILTCIGDYFFNEIKEICNMYIHRGSPNQTLQSTKRSQHVQLVINNE